MLRRKKTSELSIEELERTLRIKRRESRIERFQQLAGCGQTTTGALLGREPSPRPVVAATGRQPVPTWRQHWFSRKKSSPKPTKPRTLTDRLLLTIEIVAVFALFGVGYSAYESLQTLNADAATLQQQVVAQQELPLVPRQQPLALDRLPGGHTPPTSAEGVVPDVPLHLQQWVQPKNYSDPTAINVDVAATAFAPTRIVIPKINVDAPIIHGVGWEDLKKGVGHLPGSANPGQRGNLYLAAHNDIYGEIFRYLEELEAGDEYIIYADDQQFRYVVKEKRIIEPTEVEVMAPTTEPVATLQTCYPYMIDTHRLVVIGELAE